MTKQAIHTTNPASEFSPDDGAVREQEVVGGLAVPEVDVHDLGFLPGALVVALLRSEEAAMYTFGFSVKGVTK